ncbi:MAG: ABC transporter substrate-binding protein [Proteobacteria bacterium]|nr:ABC transporter substrate-binding protein [Pseudomonadota bacterium]
MKQRAWITGIIFVCFLFFSLSAQAADPKEFRIGAILAMTGAGSWYGEVMSQGILTAMDEINGKGGIDGIKFKTLIEDHQSGSGAAAISGFNKLVHVDKVPFSFTSYTAPTLSIIPVANEKQVLLLNGGAVGPKLVKASPYLFNNRMLAVMHGVGLTQRAKERGFTKMAALFWNDDAGLGTHKYVEPRWKAMGGTIVAAEAHPVGTTDYKPYLSKIMAANPDFLALWQWGKDWGIAVKQAREMGFDKPIMGIEFTPDAAKLAGATADGYEAVTDYFDSKGDDPWTKRFVASYKAKYNKEPEFYAANYYEGIYILAELIKKAKTKGGDYWNGKALRESLVEIRSFPSVYGGNVEFNPEDGTCRKKTALFTVKGGERLFQKYVEIK